MTEPPDVNQLLTETRHGDRRAMDRLFTLVYEELRSLAARMLSRERSDHTLQATALVHEAYFKMVDQNRVMWQDQAHFFAVAAHAIRRVLTDHARGRSRAKRGGGRTKLLLDERLFAAYDRVVDLMALDEALEALATTHPDEARIVEMRFFAGLNLEETACILGVSTRTVERQWRYARARLYQELSDDEDPRPEGGKDG